MRHIGCVYMVPASLALVALIAIALLFFAGPAADDFCRATVSDLTRHFVDSYRTHTGRWASAGFLAPLLLHRIDLFSPLGYGALLLALWLGYFAVFYFLIRVVTGASATRWTCIKGTLLIGAVWWCGLPAPGQTVYWASGGLEYGLGFQAATALLGAVILYAVWRRPGIMDLAAGLALAFATFVVTGIHELVALTVATLLTVAAVAALVEKLERRFFLLALSGIGLAGSAVSVLAPGNAVRQARIGTPVSATDFFYTFYLEWYEHLVPWLLDPRLLCLSFLILTSKEFAALQPRRNISVLSRWWVIALCTLALITGYLTLPALVYGQPGPGRLHNFAFSVFIVGWFLTLFNAGRAISLYAGPNIGVLRESVAVLFVVAILFTGNMQGAVSAALGRNDILSWRNWLQEIKEDGERVAKNNAAELVVSRIPAGPLIFTSGFQRVPDRDAAHFVNRCMAQYLGVSRLVVESGEAKEKTSRNPD